MTAQLTATPRTSAVNYNDLSSSFWFTAGQYSGSQFGNGGKMPMLGGASAGHSFSNAGDLGGRPSQFGGLGSASSVIGNVAGRMNEFGSHCDLAMSIHGGSESTSPTGIKLASLAYLQPGGGDQAALT